MKSIYYCFLSLLLSVFFFTSLHAQNCLEEGIVFTSQTQIDSFQTNYPNCIIIEGNVKIHAYSITNLSGLNVITQINGRLEIDSTNLTNLEGLNSLTYIGGSLNIGYCNSLQNFEGLDMLEQISGELNVGFSEVVNFEGMPQLTSIGGLSIWWTGTETLNGLDKLTEINGDISIQNCMELTDISALINVTSINGFILIGMNQLKSLSGLDNIDYQTIQSLTIGMNDSLSKCDVLSICDYISDPTGNLEIGNNASGCNSIEEVEEACLTINLDEKSYNNLISVYPNPCDQIIHIKTTKSEYIQSVKLYNQYGQLIFSTETSYILDVSRYMNGIYFLELQGSSFIARKKIVIK